MRSSLLSQVQNAYLERIGHSPNLKYILDIRERYESQKNKNNLSLNINNRKREKEERQKWALNTENKRRAALNLEIFDSYKAMEEFNDAKEEEDNEIDFEDDYLLKEGAQILSDYIFINRNFLLSKAA